MYYITGPLKLAVELKGEVKGGRSSLAGIYSLGPNTVNGKSHWLQDSGKHAIWYYETAENWNIASQEYIGGPKANIFSPEGLADTQDAKEWKYHNDIKWIASDDILVVAYEPGT